MKVFLTILIFTVLTINSAQGQDNGLRTKLIDDAYTWTTATSEQLDSFYFSLQPIQTTRYKTHIRILLSGQSIDFYSSDNEEYFGRLTNYITQYITVKDKKSDAKKTEAYQYFFEQIDLDQRLVNEVVKKLLNSKQFDIPTDTLMAYWHSNFMHCDAFVFHFNFNGRYTNQIFNCPWGQKDTVKFKQLVLDNYQTLKSNLQLDSLYHLFENKLPKGKSYSTDGYRMMYKMTAKQVENWSKGKSLRDYMKSVKDTVDSYIKTELKKQKIVTEDLSCHCNFHLTFGTNGKLKKVKISHYDKPKLMESIGLGDYLEDKKEIRKCKTKIRQIFKNIDLSFLNLEYEIYRTFRFDSDNGFQLSDNTIY